MIAITLASHGVGTTQCIQSFPQNFNILKELNKETIRTQYKTKTKQGPTPLRCRFSVLSDLHRSKNGLIDIFHIHVSTRMIIKSTNRDSTASKKQKI